MLSKKKYVSDELTAKVWAAIEKLGYTSNHLASGLRSGRTREIGIVIQNIRNIWFTQFLFGVETKAKELGYTLTFFDTDYDIDREKEAISILRNRWVDGIILYSCVSEKEKDVYLSFLESADTKRIPIVSIDRHFESEYISHVTYEVVSSVYEAIKHLISNGKKKILHISGRIGWDVALRRQQAYIEIMKEFGLEKNIMIRNSEFYPIEGYEICKELLNQQNAFDAILTANDQLAVGCVKAVKEAGLSIPKDIAIIGFDNLFVSTLIEPALTTINVPRYAMGVAAIEFLDNMINKSEEKIYNQERIFSTNLIIRQSTDVAGERNWELFGW